MKKAKLFKEDAILFDKMLNNYASENEKVFFENQRYKQEYVPTGMNDLVVHEGSNNEGIYIVRESYSEYLVGRVANGKIVKEFHVMTLSDALSINLKDLGCHGSDLTIWQWLRSNDYINVLYNHNYDNLE